MPMETVTRRWTVVTWLVADLDADEHVVPALAPLAADAIALQSIRERDATAVAEALGMHVAWERSHYPASRLLPGTALGLAVVSPHAIRASHGLVCNDHPSLWSTERRIAQYVTLERGDHTTYAVGHAVGPSKVGEPPTGSIPVVRAVPEQVGVDARRAIVLPEAATFVSDITERPVDGRHPYQVTVFEQPWVSGDFPSL